MSEKDRDRPLTRQALRNLGEDTSEGEQPRRYPGHSRDPNHLKRCYICYSAAEEERAAAQRYHRSRYPVPSTSQQPKPKSSDTKEKTSPAEKHSSSPGTSSSASAGRPPSRPVSPAETFKKPRSASEGSIESLQRHSPTFEATSGSSFSHKTPIRPKSPVETAKSQSRAESTKKYPARAESPSGTSGPTTKAQSPVESARQPPPKDSPVEFQKPLPRAELPAESLAKPVSKVQTPAETTTKRRTESLPESVKKSNPAAGKEQSPIEFAPKEHTHQVKTSIEPPKKPLTKVESPAKTLPSTRADSPTVTAELIKLAQAKAQPATESRILDSSLPEQSKVLEPAKGSLEGITETPIKSVYPSTQKVALATSTPITLASTTKSQPQAKQPVFTPEKPPPSTGAFHPKVSKIPLPQIPLPPMMTTTGGPLTSAQHIGALDGLHSQVSAAGVDDRTLDQCFRINPKWHYIKSTHEETTTWLETAGYEAILLELLYFVHDQGHIQHKDMEIQFEKELERAMSSIEKLECLDAFCKTFIRENKFRPAGKLSLSSAGKDDKNNRLFRMINSDLQNLQRQNRILSMVCAGTADHEVHTQAQRENVRKLVEDLVTIVHPGDRGTYSEVYKVIAESAVYDQHTMKPQLTSLKLVCHPDITVPFGGPIMAGGAAIRCDSLESKIRAKLPSLLIKMHFSDMMLDKKWPDLSQAEDSGNLSTLESSMDETGTGTPTGTGRGKGKEDKSGKTTPATTQSSASRSGKRKQPDEPTTSSKRHRQDLHTPGYESQPGDAQLINEIYGEHVAQLICSLSQAPLGYIKHCKYTVSPNDERDGTASVTGLGLIVSGENIYLTKIDASDDYLDSLVETFRMDQVAFSCLANPLNLYKGTHIKALLMFLRYICLNFPRTTYFLSD